MTEVKRFCHTEKFAGVASDVVSIPLGVDQKMLFLSGISAEATDGRWLHSDVSVGNISAQLSFVWARIGEILGYHGATYGDIVKVTFYTTDARYLMNPIGISIKDIFRDGRVPAFTGVVVVGLAWPELLVEIDVTAVVRSDPKESTL
jgi:2-iminobutanoate/2-iminopropanoate deaminase